MNIKYEIDGLEEISSDLNKLEKATADAMPEIADDIADEWRRTAPQDTGALVRSIITGNGSMTAKEFIGHNMTAQEFIHGDRAELVKQIFPSVHYEGWGSEFGNDKFPARLSAKRALENLNARDWVDDAISKQFDKVLKK